MSFVTLSWGIFNAKSHFHVDHDPHCLRSDASLAMDDRIGRAPESFYHESFGWVLRVILDVQTSFMWLKNQ